MVTRHTRAVAAFGVAVRESCRTANCAAEGFAARDLARDHQ